MRLTKIKLAGFKSFVDPTTIHLPSNLVGVVGPNGCGKSNTIDAVRWVMGESSAKNLRGDSMADVIFNGSNSRKPVGHAMIELVFDNSDGSVGGQYAQYGEISIKRQVSRDGQSSYFLNATRCRRRDITDIFLGTGLGPRSYSIIEQGMISRLIEAKPEDLRVYLEEAAGISKYKERRRETENRIRHTRENISRLDDLRDEIEKQLERLQRQARTAERYKELKQEERRVKAELLALRYRAQHDESVARERAIQERETALEAVVAEQRAIEAAMEKGREALIEANDSFNEVQGRYYGLGAEIARVEQAIQHGKDTRQQRQQELTQTEAAWSEAQAHIELDAGRLTELASELERSEPELEALREREQASTAALREAEEAMQDWQLQWEDFNRRAAEPSQTAQVERTRIDHLDRQLLQLAQRLERIEQELGNLSVAGLEQEIESLAEQETEGSERTSILDGELHEALARITELRELMQRQSAELNEVRGHQQGARGRLASLDALQQAALGRRAGAVTDWLESQGLKDAPRLAQQLHVDAGWERAVETVLGFYLEAVCIDGIDRVAGVLEGLEHGALALVDTAASAVDLPSAQTALPLLSKVRAPWALDSLLGGVYAADSLAQALQLRTGLAPHESVITSQGIWIGQGWLRVARDADERAGVIEREKEISELNEQLHGHSEVLQTLEQGLEEAREALREAEQRREALQAEVNQAHRRQSEIHAQLGARRGRLEQAHARVEALREEAEELRA
ncbi:MAG: chromosome segregation protein SMC, partial [Gammaproteobacteria bacterium]